MAKAIQCDVCRRLVPQSQARGWRTLTLNYQEIVYGDVYKSDVDPRADVCSYECAAKWFDQAMQRCFKALERQVGE